MEISLCLLTWNELHGCRRTVPTLPRRHFSEIFALDGGSTDGTVGFLKEYDVSVVQQLKKSYNAAYTQALAHYSGDAIIFYHPKGTVDGASLPSIAADLRGGADFVVASRMLPASRNEEDDKILKHRKWFGLALSHAAAARWRRQPMPRITDPLHGYRGLSRKFTEALRLLPTGVTADLEMVHHAYTTGAAISEVPVNESAREVGGTHFPAYSTGKALLRYLLTPH